MERVARTSIVDVVVARLRDQIHNGNWPVGTKVPTEAKLVEALGVSRPSVREAVRALVQVGLLESRQGDGTYVVADDEAAVALQQAVDAADDGEVLVVRRALDVLAAQQAARHRTRADVAALRASLVARRAAIVDSNMAAFIHHDIAFHVGVARAAHNGLLLMLYKSFENSMRDSILQLNCIAEIGGLHPEFHEVLLVAVERGDHRGAARAAIGVLDDHERLLYAVGS